MDRKTLAGSLRRFCDKASAHSLFIGVSAPYRCPDLVAVLVMPSASQRDPAVRLAPGVSYREQGERC
jgi:hypothetical protein